MAFSFQYICIIQKKVVTLCSKSDDKGKRIFTSVGDQAEQAIRYVRSEFNGHLDVAYGLSLGGKILSRMLKSLMG